jgi:hypothetical protein
MQKLNLLLMLVSINFLSSCNEFPTITPKERCVIVLLPEIPTMEESYCRCHMYQWSSESIGRVSDSVDHPVNYCNKLIGFNADDSLSIYSWQNNIRLWLLRNKK